MTLYEQHTVHLGILDKIRLVSGFLMTKIQWMSKLFIEASTVLDVFLADILGTIILKLL